MPKRVKNAAGKTIRWQARITVDGKQQTGPNFTRKADAEAWEAEQRTAVRRGTWVDPAAGTITLSAFFAEWSPRQVWATGTRKAMDLAVRDCTFSDMPLGQVRRSHAEAWVRSMADRLAPGTVRTRRNNVRTVLNAARLDGRIASDPTEGVTLPRLRRDEASIVLPTVAQVAAVLTESGPAGAVLLKLAAFGGLRLGECCALQVGDIDPLRGVIRVRRQVQRAEDGEVEVTLPKYGSERDVFAPSELLADLASYVAEHRPGTDRGRWVVVGEDGLRPWHQNSAGHAWRTACKRAGVEGVRFHDLRHFYASGLIADGCDAVTVARSLGHRNTQQTYNRYAHLWPNAADRTRAAAGGLMAGVTAAQDDDQKDSTRTNLAL